MNSGYENKKIWVKVEPWNKEIVTTALEAGADAIMVSSENTKKVKSLGVIDVVSSDGDIQTERDVIEFEIKGREDEEKIVELSRTKMVIARTKDWTIIPIENLVARTGNLLMEAKNLEETKTFLTILEKGVDGIVITSQDLGEVQKIIRWLKGTTSQISLSKAVIKRLFPLGMGDRVCVDTCSMMTQGEGMLVGNSSAAMFLVHSESIENPYVEPRPFRVNAGPVHAYIKVPGGKTQYLSELKSGDEVLIANYTGEVRAAVVGRIKREKRPLLFLEALCDNKIINIILQNAETIRLTTPEGKPVSIVELREGNEVLVTLESAGRHFGYKVEETIEEV